METAVPNSFIPQDATSMQNPRKYRDAGGLGDLFMLLSIVLCIASIGLAVAVFLYSGYLQTESSSKQKQIDDAKTNFNSGLIQKIGKLADRMQASELLLGAHIAPTAFLGALNQSTLQTVSFTSLNINSPDIDHYTIKMTGVARSVNSIALQADLFSKNGVILNPIFSGIDRQADGVHFTVNAGLNTAAINYGSLLNTATPASGVNPLPANTLPTETSATSSVPGTTGAQKTP
jgi:hypothetical protein